MSSFVAPLRNEEYNFDVSNARSSEVRTCMFPLRKREKIGCHITDEKPLPKLFGNPLLTFQVLVHYTYAEKISIYSSRVAWITVFHWVESKAISHYVAFTQLRNLENQNYLLTTQELTQGFPHGYSEPALRQPMLLAPDFLNSLLQQSCVFLTRKKILATQPGDPGPL